MTAVDLARTPPSWALIDAQAQRLRDRRPEDVFLDQVLTGALRVAQDAGNPIRGNQFAAASRELATHLLNALAPEAQVRACAWFVQAKDTPTVTRAQRALFIAHGGLAPDYVEKTLGFASVDFTTPLKQAMDELNKRTHVKPDTVLGEEEPVRWLAAKIFDAIEGLLEAADECRSEVVVELRDQIDPQLLERMIGETIGELDILSGHTLVDRPETTEIEVTEITADRIRFRIEGAVYVNLQWGSGSDFRDGDGASMSEEFPFSAGLITATADPSKFEAVIDLNVDTDGWYE
jgi:hypothetical protein